MQYCKKRGYGVPCEVCANCPVVADCLDDVGCLI